MMVQYVDDGDVAIFNNLSFRRDKKTGYYLSAKRMNGKGVRLHVYVWEFYNGAVPKGFHVHHKDFDKNNNEPENLVLMSASEHSKLHGRLWTEERYDAHLKMLREKAVPKATEWHKSDEGRAWHREQYEKNKDKLHMKMEFICLNCGKSFIAEKTGNNRYCSNNCKSAYRRKSGVDNETRRCEVCGAEFTTNKYSKARTCSRKCSHILPKNKKSQ